MNQNLALVCIGLLVVSPVLRSKGALAKESFGGDPSIISSLVHQNPQKIDPLQQELELSSADFQGLRDHMKAVRAFDKEVASRTDISPQKAKGMSSEDLIYQASKSGLFAIYMLYDNPSIGVYRATLTSPTLIELSQRSDLGQAFAAAYRHMPLDPTKDRRFDKETGSMQVIATDTLIQYPPIRRKLVGHEKAILIAMADVLAREMKVNASFPKGKELYGNFFSTVGAAGKLLAQAKPSLKVDPTHFKTAEGGMKAILDQAKSLN